MKKTKEYDYMLLIPTLLTDEQQHAMMARLESELVPAEQNGIIPHVRAQFAAAIGNYWLSICDLFQHPDLFWAVILPEWAISLFMEKFSFSRSDAIAIVDSQFEETIKGFSLINL